METLPEDSSWLSFQLPPAEAHSSARTDPIGRGRNSCRQDRPVLTLPLLGPHAGQNPHLAKQLSLLDLPVKYLERWAEGQLYLSCLPTRPSQS